MERATSAWCCREKVALVASKTSIALITSNNTKQHVYESWNTKNISITFVHCEDKYHIERKDIRTEE